MSIYREESIEALIEALRRKDFPSHQLMAIGVLLSISGRLTSSGDSYTEAWLLKRAGFDQPYNAIKKAERLQKLGRDLKEIPVCLNILLITNVFSLLIIISLSISSSLSTTVIPTG